MDGCFIFVLPSGGRSGILIAEIYIFLERCCGFLWGIPVLAMILLTGGYLTVRSRGLQVRLFPAAVRDFGKRLFRRGEDSSFRALCTALAATVGTGNIAGVAGAIAIGGPGAVFWMLVSAFLGMAVKFAECVLAVRFRQKSPSGELLGGPMYTIQNGLPERFRFLAGVYCFLGLFASFGVGNAAQINAVVCTLRETGESFGFSYDPRLGLCVGVFLAIAVYRMVSGGAGGIGRTAEILIPVVSGAYILLCAAAVAVHWRQIPAVLSAILMGAFQPRAVTGGVVGSVLVSLRTGVSKGTFTNEAGMGTAAIAHGGADVDHPVRQGLMGIMEVFLDTVVICTLTALVILTSGVEIPYGTAAGAELTARALAATYGTWVSAFLCGCLSLFALATVLGWSLYAGRCGEYLLGSIHWRWFAAVQAAVVILGTVMDTGLVWTVSELMNGLMAIPNLISVLLLSPEVFRLTNDFSRQ